MIEEKQTGIVATGFLEQCDSIAAAQSCCLVFIYAYLPFSQCALEQFTPENLTWSGLVLCQGQP